jgi:lysophospholipase L1-like esterase
MGGLMLDCMIIGDSIAVGVSQIRTECAAIVKSGINSQTWIQKHLDKIITSPTKTLVISLGANDYKGIDTEANIRLLRNLAEADRVFWLLPSQKLKPNQVEAVKKVAAEFGDTVIPRPESDISADGVHPTYKGYKVLAEKTK